MDGDGNINYEEFVTMLFKVKSSQKKKVQKYKFTTNGNDHDGNINYEEFVTMLFKVKINKYKKKHISSYMKSLQMVTSTMKSLLPCSSR